MNIQQFQYVLAVAEKQHFEQAAQKCFVTQSTLSTMISKFEDELGFNIFDRKKKPVKVTTEGEAVIEHLKKVMKEIEYLDELSGEIKGEVRGNLSIAVIPTIAPSLLPLFLQSFANRFPDLRISVREQTTSEIIRNLKSRELDIGILSIPVKDKDIVEIKLYDEPFVFFNAGKKSKGEVEVEDLDLGKLCLLEEGHCMRTQIIRLCDLDKKRMGSKLNFEYKAGSIDSLLRFVKANQATTLLPFLCSRGMSEEDASHISYFSDPVPFRSVGLVVHRHFVKRKILEMLKDEIVSKVGLVLPEMDLIGKNLLPV